MKNKSGEIYTKELLEELVLKSRTVSDVCRKLGLRTDGNRHTFISSKIRQFGIDISHFMSPSEYCKISGIRNNRKKSPYEYLTLKTPEKKETPGYTLRRALLEIGRLYMCADCGLSGEWNGKPLRLQVDHVNGKGWDDRQENLRFMCPNCHSQTETFCSRNKTSQKVTPTCPDCGGKKNRSAKTCAACRWKRSRANHTEKEKVSFVRKHKVVHPTEEELRELIANSPLTKIALQFGVSDSAIRKWAKGYGIETRKPKKPKKETKPQLIRTRAIIDEKAWCYGHKNYVPVDEFTKDKNSNIGLHGCCRECRRKEKGRSKKNKASLVE